MFNMELYALAENENVIEINSPKFIEKWPQHLCHQPHDSCWSITQPNSNTLHSYGPSLVLKALFIRLLRESLFDDIHSKDLI